MAEQKNPHTGHRARMRARFKASAPATFASHELLEMLLYHTNARGDTNETAHALIEAFGSIEGILDADRSHLETVFGIGENAAIFLSLIGELAKRYTAEKLSAGSVRPAALDTPKKLAAFLLPRFIGATKELAYALLLDNSLRPLDCFPVGDGSVSSVSISVRTVAERAYTKHAAAVVVAHNHPSGLAIPSNDDFALTHRLKEALDLLEIPLLEHFIFSDRSYTPLLGRLTERTHGAADLAASPILDLFKKQ
ncbi:MAG: DNA repair protein RadC [Clostridia bacterium]|nr:DNA repair protein RadC [Clostridia bacterium]